MVDTGCRKARKTRVLNSIQFFRPEPVPTVTLFIPALFWPHSGVDCDVPVVPALRTLIGRSDATEALCDDGHAWLCGQFSVERQFDWPVAPIALLGTGTLPGDNFWLSADPVHLQVNRDQLVLLASESLAITQDEANLLCATLNHHFATDHFTFLAPQPHRWFLGTSRPARIRTHGLLRATGQDVDRLLPAGEDRLVWHRIFNEAQMLLHEHPVNEKREKRGALPVNSLWFSGGGTLPRAHTSFQAVVGSSAMLQGLCKLAQVPFSAAEQGVGEMRARELLIELDDAANAALCIDAVAWKNALESLERRWFAPLAKLLRNGRIRRLVVVTVANGRSYRWSVSRMNLWRLWKPAAALTAPANPP
jgi:hypothetical protein